MSDILDLNVDLPWTKSDGSEADIVLATRIRLARNIKGCLMPQKFGAEHGGMEKLEREQEGRRDTSVDQER